MSIFVETPDQAALNVLTNPDTLTKAHPEYASHFDAITLERPAQNQAWEGLHRPHFRKVADLTFPADMSLKMILGPDYLADKQAFYKWLDDNPRYVSYDRRKHGARRGDMATFVNGKVVI